MNIYPTISDLTSTSSIHRFAFNAMATVFEVYINHPDKKYAEQAALESFKLLEILEQELSCFIENSDVSRINKSTVNEFTCIGQNCMHCIVKAIEYRDKTYGAFEPYTGFLKSEFLSVKHKPEAINQKLELFPEDLLVKILDSPVYLDLGGIGKGYAIDKIREFLEEWDLTDFLIHGGFSSVLAIGNFPGMNGWPVNIRNPGNEKMVIRKIFLQNNSVSSSGLLKGGHIFNPRTGRIAENNRATFILGPDAIFTDCISTATMILSLKETEKLISSYSGSSAIIIDHEPFKLSYFGFKDS